MIRPSFRELLEALPKPPTAVIKRGLPVLELIYNEPLTEEEKARLREAIRRSFGDKYDVEIRDESSR